MTEPPFVLSEGRVTATLSLSIYHITAIKKTAYRLARRFSIMIGEPADQHVPITFLFPSGTSEASARDAVRLFYGELLDQELREEIAAETAPIRALILANAFSKTNLLREK